MSKASRRVVVTGVGAVSAAGKDAAGMFRAVIEGRSAMRAISRFDPTGFPVRIAASDRDVDGADHDLYREFGVAAARMATEDARFDVSRDAARTGVVAGSALGSVAVLERDRAAGYPCFATGAWSESSLAQEIAARLDASGGSLMVNSSFASGADAIGVAARRIQDGLLDCALAGGSEAPVTPSVVAGFASLGALAEGNGDPARAIRPFDRDRHGCGLGEGAAFLMLEERARAIERGATILAELIGYGSTMDAFHITQLPEDGGGLCRAMRCALDDAGIAPQCIDYLNAHGTGTDMNDRIETRAIREVFGSHADRLPVSSTKAVTGHLLGAAGALEAVITILAMKASLLPPTINWATRDPDCDLDYIPGDARLMDIRVAMTNSMGFGGHNASLVFAKDRR